MKKTLLCIALFAASIPSMASSMHGSLSGVSGAAYSTGTYSEAVLLNPSLGASFDPDKDDFSFIIGLGAAVSDADDMVDQADELVDFLDELETQTVLTQGDADELKHRLTEIDGDYAVASIGASSVLSIPTNLVSVSIIANAYGNVIGAPDVAQSDLDLIDSYIENNLDPDNLEDELQSTVNAKGALVTEFGVSFSKAFEMSRGKHLLVGLKPKKMEIENILYSETVANFDSDDLDADDYTRKDDMMNVDIGVTYIDGNMRYGFVANNLQEKEFKFIDSNESVSIERQFITSVGYVTGNFKAEVSYDLNPVEAIGLDRDSQMLRAGVEYSAWDLVRLRAGLARDQKDTFDNTYSFGVGAGAFNLAYITGSNETQGVALSGGIRF